MKVEGEDDDRWRDKETRGDSEKERDAECHYFSR